jgi:mannose-6-phosphate isomerase-like protein (cupin superfamily)
MARAGQVIENPVTGVKLIFHKTAHESDGASWEAEEFLKPFAGKISMAHYHPHMDEIFAIISGSARYVLDGVEHQASAGDVVTLPAGIPHIHPWSDSAEGLHIRRLN